MIAKAVHEMEIRPFWQYGAITIRPEVDNEFMSDILRKKASLKKGKEKGGIAMDLKLSGLEASAVMNALQSYLKELEKAGGEKGILIE